MALVLVALGCVVVVLLAMWIWRERDVVAAERDIAAEDLALPLPSVGERDVSVLFEAQWSLRRYTAKSICDALDALCALSVIEHAPEHVAREQANCYALLLSMSRSEPRFLETLEKLGWPHVGGHRRSLNAVRQVLWTKHHEALTRAHAARDRTPE